MYTENDSLQSDSSVYLVSELTEEQLQTSYVDYSQSLEVQKCFVSLDFSYTLNTRQDSINNLVYNKETTFVTSSVSISYNLDTPNYGRSLEYSYDIKEGRASKSHTQLHASKGLAYLFSTNYRHCGRITFIPSASGGINFRIAAQSGNCYQQLWILEQIDGIWYTKAKAARNCNYYNYLNGQQFIAGRTYMIVAPYTPSDNYHSIATVTSGGYIGWGSYSAITFYSVIPYIDITMWDNSDWLDVPTLLTRTIDDITSSFLSTVEVLAQSLDARDYDNDLIFSLNHNLFGLVKNSYPEQYRVTGMADIGQAAVFSISVAIPSSQTMALYNLYDGGWPVYSKAYMFDSTGMLFAQSYPYDWDANSQAIESWGARFNDTKYTLVIGTSNLTIENARLGIDPDNTGTKSVDWYFTQSMHIESSNITYQTFGPPNQFLTLVESEFSNTSIVLKSELQAPIYGAIVDFLYDILTKPSIVMNINYDKFYIEAKILDLATDHYEFIEGTFNILNDFIGFESTTLDTLQAIRNFDGNSLCDLVYTKWSTESITKGVIYDKHSSNELIFNMAYDIHGRLGGFITKSYIEEVPNYPSYLDGNTALWDAPMFKYLDGNSRVIAPIQDFALATYHDKSIIDIIPYDFTDVNTTSMVVSHGPAEIEYSQGSIFVNNKLLNIDKIYQVIDNVQILNILPNYWVYTIRNSSLFGDFLLKPGSLTRDISYLEAYNADTTFTINFPRNRTFNLRSFSKPLVESLENQIGDFTWRNSNSTILESDLINSSALLIVYPNNLEPVVLAFTVLQGNTDNYYFDGRGFYYFETLPTEPIEQEPIALLADLLVGSVILPIALSALSYMPANSYLDTVLLDLSQSIVLYHPAALVNKPRPMIARKVSETYVIPSTDNFNTVTLLRSEYQLVGVVVIQDENYWCKLTWVARDTYHIDTYNLIDDLSKISSIKLRVVTEFNKYI